MNLSADFDESTRRIQVLADRIVHHRFNHGEGHPLASKVVEGVFDQLPAKATTLHSFIDGKIWNAPLLGFAVQSSGDVADNLPFEFSDENAIRIRGNVFIHMTTFAMSPVMTGQDAKLLFDVLVDRDPLEALDRDASKFVKIMGLPEPDDHGEDSVESGLLVE
ncbi:MAG: hypothetical protein U0941_30895 [Planctomycetaceae bacterium]